MVLKLILDKYNLPPEIRESLEKDLEIMINYNESHAKKLQTTIDSISIDIEKYKKQIESDQNVILQNSKMATIGEVTATISHEINNSLMAIVMASVVINQDLEKDCRSPSIEVSLNVINKTTQNMSALIKNIKKFSFNGQEKFQLVSESPFSLIQQSIEICSHLSKKMNIKTEHISNIHPDAKFNIPSSELGQILLNLIKNALDHVEKLEKQSRWIRIESNIVHGTLHIAVFNGGDKPSKEIQKKLFTPFFTTKDIGKGTGIGLSLSKKMMENASGKIYFDNSQEEICFKIELPVV